MVIAERQKYPQIGNIYQMVVSRVKDAARRIVRPHLRCVTGEAQAFLAEMFLAIVVVDKHDRMRVVTGTSLSGSVDYGWCRYIKTNIIEELTILSLYLEQI